MSFKNDLQFLDMCFEKYFPFALDFVTIRQLYQQFVIGSMLHLVAWYLLYQLSADKCLRGTSIQ